MYIYVFIRRHTYVMYAEFSRSSCQLSDLKTTSKQRCQRQQQLLPSGQRSVATQENKFVSRPFLSATRATYVRQDDSRLFLVAKKRNTCNVKPDNCQQTISSGNIGNLNKKENIVFVKPFPSANLSTKKLGEHVCIFFVNNRCKIGW